MFVELHPQRDGRVRWFLFSAALHCLLLVLLARTTCSKLPATTFVISSDLVLGKTNPSAAVGYVSQRGVNWSGVQRHTARDEILGTDTTRPKRHQRHQIPPVTAPRDNADTATGESKRLGSPFGSLAKGPIVGYVVKPALPIIFPDVPRSGIPPSIDGNVVAEITIDKHGYVVETVILQSLGREIDTRVIETLNNWQFTPATMDGVAIASKQDVYFHFPR